MKPENAINIPEKYKIKIETMNQEEIPKRKTPIRIRTTSSTVEPFLIQPTTDIPTFSLVETSNPSNKVKNRIDIK